MSNRSFEIIQLLLTQQASPPPAPPSGDLQLWSKTDGTLHIQNSSSVDAVLAILGAQTFTGLQTFNAGISIPTGQSITGAGAAAISGFTSVSAGTLASTDGITNTAPLNGLSLLSLAGSGIFTSVFTLNSGGGGANFITGVGGNLNIDFASGTSLIVGVGGAGSATQVLAVNSTGLALGTNHLSYGGTAAGLSFTSANLMQASAGASITSTNLAVAPLTILSNAGAGSGQTAIKFLDIAGTGGWLVGRSLSSTDANDFFFYDLATSTNILALTSTGLAVTGALSASSYLGVNGATAVAPTAGYGTPTGNSITTNFPGATATLAQTTGTLAQVILDLKRAGIVLN